MTRTLVLSSLCFLVAPAQQPPAAARPGITGRAGATKPAAATAPPVTFHQALQIAEKYTTAHKVPMERYWLREVVWVHGEIKMGRPWWENSYWHLWWSGPVSDSVYIDIDMRGLAVRRPSE